MPPRVTDTPGTGWERLAAALRQALPVAEIDGIWAFRAIRSGPRELGTAILSRVDGDRRRIYTARYGLMIKGRQRGEFEWGIAEVGSGPLEALEELLALVPARGVDDDPPLPIAPENWFPPEAVPDGEPAD